MLVVLIGDGCSLWFSAARLIELFNRVGLRILILEATNQLERFQAGPLPHCLCSIPPIPSGLLQDAAMNQSESSIMFLMTMHRAPRKAKLKLDKPAFNDSLIVRPCTHPTNSISYHPQIYVNYLKRRLIMNNNISFARLKDNQYDITKVLNDLPKGIPSVIINLHNESIDLGSVSLAMAHWDGIADWKMPEFVHWIKKKKNINCQVDQSIHCEYPIYNIVSNNNSFDLSGAIITSQTIVDIVNQNIQNMKLRWPRL